MWTGTTITDGVVTLRPPAEADLDEIADCIRSSLPELEPFMPWAVGEYDDRDTLDWIRRAGDGDEHPFVVLDPDGAIVGACGLNRFSDLDRCANLGYWIRTSRTGRGYATRATRLLARRAFDDLRLVRVEIVMSVENTASRRVAERAGAHHEGTLRNRLRLLGRHHDAHVFSLVPGDLDPIDQPRR